MALINSSILCLPMVCASAQRLPLKLRPNLWPGWRRVTPLQSTRTALSSFSHALHSGKRQPFLSQISTLPRRLHSNRRRLMAMRTTSPSPRSLYGTRRSYFEKSDKGPETTTEQKDSCSIILVIFLVIILVIVVVLICWLTTPVGPVVSAEDVRTQLPDAKILAEREKLRKEEEQLNKRSASYPKCVKRCSECDEWRENLRKQRKGLAGKVEALDKRELEHLRQRTKVLEWRRETQTGSAGLDSVPPKGSPRFPSSDVPRDGRKGFHKPVSDQLTHIEYRRDPT